MSLSECFINHEGHGGMEEIRLEKLRISVYSVVEILIRLVSFFRVRDR